MKTQKRKINNLVLGICHIIKENDNGYLIYSENNVEHFIITTEIKEDCFYYVSYYKSLDKALNDFNSLEKKEENLSESYRKQIEKNIMLNNYLDDILNYCLDTLNYFESSNKKKYDVTELVMYLSSVPEKIEEIKIMVTEIIENGR